ncbi:hypothetical protein KQY30_09920 [Streptomyces sp. GMY02]|uniref:hypothetical protein n=1 Tax=Streptomyces sp. GMY02 TaxID=1333528 RepID=UPI001C2BAF2F|nr:hypothetical protein [Streptomyces sp. GMY02]QXE34555.1 hypothetical protein KQY30_09920 [Streptomyces sp. GMY02]
MPNHSTTQVARRAIFALAMIAGLLGALFAGPATAATAAEPPSTSATNGYQVRVCVGEGHPDIKAFTINGFNQNNNYVASPKTDLPGNRYGLRCQIIWNWYWKNWIDVDFWDYSDAKLDTRQCYVPESGMYDTYECMFG